MHALRGPNDLPNPHPWMTEGRDRSMLLEVSQLTGRRFVARERAKVLIAVAHPDRRDQLSSEARRLSYI